MSRNDIVESSLYIKILIRRYCNEKLDIFLSFLCMQNIEKE